MVTRRIEAAQKKVEERHFDVRKHLLEYDEVMDEQRKQVYSYRQRILDGGNCRQLILEMIDKQIRAGCPTYSSRRIAGRRLRVGPPTKWVSRSKFAPSTGWTANGWRIISGTKRDGKPNKISRKKSKKTFRDGRGSVGMELVGPLEMGQCAVWAQHERP